MKVYKVEFQVEVPETCSDKDIQLAMKKIVPTLNATKFGSSKTKGTITLMAISADQSKNVRRSLLPEERRVGERRTRVR